MSQVTFVNLLSPEYAKHIELYISNAAGPSQERSIGGGYFVDKRHADNLVALAQKTNTTLIVESAYRTPGLIVDGGKATGSSHSIGQSVDVAGYKMPGESTTQALSEKAKRKMELGATVMTDAELKQKLNFGAAIYKPKPGQGVLTDAKAKSLTDGQIKELKDIWAAESMHFESVGNLTDMKDLSKDEIAFMAAAASAKSKDRLVDTKTGVDYRVKEFTIDLDKSMIVDTKYTDRAGMPAPKGALLSDNSQNNYVADPRVTPEIKKSVEIMKRSAASGRGSASDSTSELDDLLGVSDGKQGNMGEFMSFNPSAVPIPSRAKDGTIPRVVEIDSRQFNNGIDNYRDAAQIKKITNKLVKNAMPGRHPFGAQLKQDGPPAAIKLVLDDVFKSKRTPEAVKAWERIVSSGIDYIDNFVIARMSEVNAERYQILQSVTDDYKIYFSGKSPVVTSIGGHMLNTYNQQWWYDFEYFYDNYLRGSKAVENKIRAFLTIADTIYDILILKFGVQIDANFDDSVMFSIDFVTLQKLHIGEYQTPDQRGADKNNAPKSANMSSTQTEYSDSTKQLIENMTLDSESAGARGYPGTSVKNSTVDLNELEYALGGKGAIDTSKYNLDSIKTFNPSGATSQIASNQKSARDDLKNTPYADLQRQLRLSKNAINSGTSLDTVNALANTNTQERNAAPTKSSGAGTEYFSKGSSAAVGKYNSARKLTQQELTQSFKTLGSDISGIESSANAIMNNMKTDARKFEQSTVNSREDIERIWANNPRDVNDFMNRVGDSVPALNNLAMQSGQFTEEFKQNYETPVKNLGRDVNNTLKTTGNLLKGLGQGFVDSFNAGRKNASNV